MIELRITTLIISITSSNSGSRSTNTIIRHIRPNFHCNRHEQMTASLVQLIIGLRTIGFNTAITSIQSECRSNSTIPIILVIRCYYEWKDIPPNLVDKVFVVVPNQGIGITCGMQDFIAMISSKGYLCD